MTIAYTRDIQLLGHDHGKSIAQVSIYHGHNNPEQSLMLFSLKKFN